MEQQQTPSPPQTHEADSSEQAMQSQTGGETEAISDALTVLLVPTDGGSVRCEIRAQEPPIDLETALERLKRKVDSMDAALLRAAVDDMHRVAGVVTHFAASTAGCMARAADVEDLSATTRARVAMQAQADGAPTKRPRTVDSEPVWLIDPDGMLTDLRRHSCSWSRF